MELGQTYRITYSVNGYSPGVAGTHTDSFTGTVTQNDGWIKIEDGRVSMLMPESCITEAIPA